MREFSAHIERLGWQSGSTLNRYYAALAATNFIVSLNYGPSSTGRGT